MDGLEWKAILKWMIWWYPYFWTHPYIPNISPNVAPSNIQGASLLRGSKPQIRFTVSRGFGHGEKKHQYPID